MGRITKKENFPGLPCPVRGQSYVLGGDPKGKNFIYCTEKHVIVRDVENVKENFAYTEHQKKPTCAKYSPSGYYICSGDACGKVRIWDTTQETHILKNEFQPISGLIKDISWDGESKRIAVCGEGRQLYAAAFLWDSGSTVGTLNAMEKSCNSIAIKQNRPYRCAIASEDYSSYFYQGPPFKLAKNNGDATNFCNCVRFAPDGSYYAVASSDRNVYLYDGKTSDFVGKLEEGNGAHKGGVYSLDFSPDSKQLVTASADKSLRVWDVESKSMIQDLPVGTETDHQQLSCLWQGTNIFSVSLSGDINIFDTSDYSKAPRVISGHKKNITDVTVGKNNTIYTVSFDGVMVAWNAETGEAVKFAGKGHNSGVTAVTYDSANDQLISIGIDDTLRYTQCEGVTHAKDAVSVSLSSQPSSLAINAEYIVVGCEKSVELIKGTQILDSKTVKTACRATISSGNHVAVTICLPPVGGVEKQEVDLYEVINDKLVPNTECPKLTGFQNVAEVAYSSDGARLVVANNKELLIYEVAGNYAQPKIMTGASTRITGMAWAPDNRHLATYSIDSSIYIWDAVDAQFLAKITSAHPKANVSGLSWLKEDVLVSVGSDCAVSQWDIEF